MGAEKCHYKYLCKFCDKTFWESIEKCCPERLEECRLGCNHSYAWIGMGVAVCIFCDDRIIGAGIAC